MNAAFSEVALPFAEVLASLSYALDLTGGQPMGHAQRSCLIGLKIGMQYGLSQDDLTSLYFALLMKDSGCSSNAARMYEIFGTDELKSKRDAQIIDPSNFLEAMKYAIEHTNPDASMLSRAKKLLSLAASPNEQAKLMESRCNRGAQIATLLGLGETSSQCILNITEHWDGRGQPNGLSGEQIPILSRIGCLAHVLEVFVRTYGREEAYAVIEKRSRKWFDPELVRIAQTFRKDEAFWTAVSDYPREALMQLDIRATFEAATEDRIDAVCDAFAQIIDAKSSFTAEHSSRVCSYTIEIAEAMGISGRALTTLRRAALLHDVGKLAVSNSILDKPGKPTDEEWIAIKKHPYYTQQILVQIPGFERLNEIASAHHERLDGKGYFRGLKAKELDQEMRILAVADVFDALSAERPYRGALPMEQVFAILDKDANIALCGESIGILKDKYLYGNTQQVPMLKAA